MCVRTYNVCVYNVWVMWLAGSYPMGAIWSVGYVCKLETLERYIARRLAIWLARSEAYGWWVMGMSWREV